MTIEAVVNGAVRSLPPDSTVEDVVVGLAPSRFGVAVAVNGSVISRSQWGTVAIADGDRVEILSAAQGG